MPVVSQDLSDQGAVIDLLVGVSAPRREKLERVGFAVPEPVRVRALIDTGSHATGFDPSVFHALDITSVGYFRVRTASTGEAPHVAEQFQVSLSLVHDHSALKVHHSDLLVFASNFTDAGDVKGLIGRDVLKGCLFVYDGERGCFTFAF